MANACGPTAAAPGRTDVTRALVTGGAGFIGSHTVDALLARGYEVRVLDLLTPPVHDGSVPSYVPPEVEFVRGDVTDPPTMLRALDGVSIVYHMAAYQDYLTDFSTFFRTNAVGTALLYELILRERRNVDLVVVASSQAVYGEGRYECSEDGTVYPGPRREEQLERGEWETRCPTCGGPLEPGWTDEPVLNPHNSYGFSKRDQDDIAIQLGRRYRIMNSYSGALRSFTVQLASGSAALVYEDGQQIRDYVGIKDVILANLLPLDRPEALYHSYNVGGNRSIRVLELAEEVQRAVATTLGPVIPGVYRVGDTRHIRSAVGALQSLGWSVTQPLSAVVDDYVRWAVVAPGFRNAAKAAQERMRSLGVLRSVGRPAASVVSGAELASSADQRTEDSD